MKHLSDSEIWSFEAQAIHTKDYVKDYMNALQLVLPSHDAKILDTAAGVGFPTEDLYVSGYHNITSLDGDSESAAYSIRIFAEKNIPISVAVGKWQALSQNVHDTYDVLVNLDNSLVYMDGWSGAGSMTEGTEAVFGRFRIVLREFLAVVKPGGRVILGLGKHYEPTHQGIPEGGGSKDNKVVPFDLVRDGEPVKMTWHIHRDWNKRHHDSRAVVEAEDFSGDILRIAYLITKDELMMLMKEVGFSQVHLLIPDGTRDNLIIGIK